MGRPTGHQIVEGLQQGVGAASPLAAGDPARLPLLGLLAAHTDAEDQAPRRQVLQRLDLLDHPGRVAQGGQQDGRAQRDPLGDRGGGAQHGETLQDGHVELQVVTRPDRVEAELLQAPGVGRQVAQAASVGVKRGQQHADLRRRAHSPTRRLRPSHLASRRTRRMIFPELVLGSASTNSTARGRL